MSAFGGATTTAMKTATIISFIATLFAISPHAAAAGSPQRIVSLNMCADELLLALADPDQIVDLSPYAADRTLSFMADKAAGFRHDAAEAETVIELHPDLVLSGSYSKRATQEMLIRLGYRVELVDDVRSIDECSGSFSNSH